MKLRLWLRDIKAAQEINSFNTQTLLHISVKGGFYYLYSCFYIIQQDSCLKSPINIIFIELLKQKNYQLMDRISWRY